VVIVFNASSGSVNAIFKAHVQSILMLMPSTFQFSKLHLNEPDWSPCYHALFWNVFELKSACLKIST
jgi:hypothetical protein